MIFHISNSVLKLHYYSILGKCIQPNNYKLIFPLRLTLFYCLLAIGLSLSSKTRQCAARKFCENPSNGLICNFYTLIVLQVLTPKGCSCSWVVNKGMFYIIFD